MKTHNYFHYLLIGLGIGFLCSVFLNLAFTQVFGVAYIYFPILIAGTVLGGVISSIVYLIVIRKKEKTKTAPYVSVKYSPPRHNLLPHGTIS